MERDAAAQGPGPAAPLNLAGALAALLLCQLAGEVIVLAVRQIMPSLAFPGPVVGMALLFVVLVWRGGPGRSLDATAGGILRNLSLLFVPAAVGIVQYGPVLAEFGLALAVALVVSTALTLLVTVGVFLLVARLAAPGDDEDAS
ncbi:MAG: CidA/LrgA family protein [Mesorhizobium sp.]|nr:CidA/LrgA family protein [Mesorhizobium sp.]